MAVLTLREVAGWVVHRYGHQLAFFTPPWVSLVEASGLLVAALSKWSILGP